MKRVTCIWRLQKSPGLLLLSLCKTPEDFKVLDAIATPVCELQYTFCLTHSSTMQQMIEA